MQKRSSFSFKIKLSIKENLMNIFKKSIGFISKLFEQVIFRKIELRVRIFHFRTKEY